MKNRQGFTLIELLVVMSVIGVLASVIISSMNDARVLATDSARIASVDQIAKALYLYEFHNGDWMETGSGCGNNGDGNGFFNLDGGSYPESMAQCLIDSEATKQIIIDPSGDVTSDATTGNAFMKYTCQEGGETVTYVYAKLNGTPQSDTATDGTCCPGCDEDNWGMNYYKKIF